MNKLDRILDVLVGMAARLMRPARRDWIEALWAERYDIPGGWPRLSWSAGGLWLVAREAQMFYRTAYVAVFAAGLGGVLWVRSTSGGLPLFSVIGLSAIGLMLIALPWVARRRAVFGPVADHRAARAARVGGYAALIAFLVVGLGAARYGDAGKTNLPGNGNLPIWIFVLLVWTVYAAGILAFTGRRSPATSTTLTIGLVTGAVGGLIVYALTPFSGRLHFANGWLAAAYNIGLVLVIVGVPALAGAAAAGAWSPSTTAADSEAVATAQVRQGALGGALCAAAAVLVMGVLTLTTLLIMPERVSVEWANPDRNVPHGTPEEIHMSVGDDVMKYINLLLAGPAIGVMLGTVGAAVRLRERKDPLAGQRQDPQTPATAV